MLTRLRSQSSFCVCVCMLMCLSVACMQWELAEHLPLRLDMLDGKYPSNTSKIIQQSLLLLRSSALSLISPTQGFSCSWFICLYLHLYSTTLMLTLSLFTKIGIRGSFIHRGIDFNACLFSPSTPSSLFLSWQMPRWEENRGETSQEEEGEEGKRLFRPVSSSEGHGGSGSAAAARAALYPLWWSSSFLSLCVKRHVTPGNHTSDNSRDNICYSEASWGFSWLEMIEWHP